MDEKLLTPDLIFESSWEVCNKVGGIFTVLSTRAKSLKDIYGDQLVFIGPDLGTGNVDFLESSTLLAAWKKQAQKDGLAIRVGRWDVPGKPIVVLLKFDHNFSKRDEIYADVWNWFGVDSMQAYGDYDEACLFAWACGQVIESYVHFFGVENKSIVAHFNEWMTGFGLLYCKQYLPQVATIFTTHATSIGRSISGNNKPLYDYMAGYNGDQMASELNMVSKHSVEKMAARFADCFTTVSRITAKECKQLLDKEPDVITPNGFEDQFVPKGKRAEEAKTSARAMLKKVTEALSGGLLHEDALYVATSGRNEFRNKGLDVLIESLSQLRTLSTLHKEVVAFILVPGDVKAPRQEVMDRLETGFVEAQSPLYYPWTTHWLNYIEHNNVLEMIKAKGLMNLDHDKVKIIYVPCYLNGKDGILNKVYYELLPGFDLTVFPSYYEPWGYTPLESIAFSVPTITTNLAGFGDWVKQECAISSIEDGVAVLERNDHNHDTVSKAIAEIISNYSTKTETERKQISIQAKKCSKKAHWSEFIGSYKKAYDFALRHAHSLQNRNSIK